MKISAATLAAAMLPLFLPSITPGIDGASTDGSSAGVGREALLRLARTAEGKHNVLLQHLRRNSIIGSGTVVKATNAVEDGSTKNSRKLSEDECLAAVTRLDAFEAACPRKCNRDFEKLLSDLDFFGVKGIVGSGFGTADGELPACDAFEDARDPTTCGADSGTSCADTLRGIDDSFYEDTIAGLRSCEVAGDYATFGDDDKPKLLALYVQYAAEKCGYGPDVISFPIDPDDAAVAAAEEAAAKLLAATLAAAAAAAAADPNTAPSVALSGCASITIFAIALTGLELLI